MHIGTWHQSHLATNTARSEALHFDNDYLWPFGSLVPLAPTQRKPSINLAQRVNEGQRRARA
jgi:hypothetical protein